MGKKLTGKKTTRVSNDRFETPKYECQDCFSEALMYCGIIETLPEPPRDQLKKFHKAYKSEFYANHIDPNGWRSTIRPRISA